MKNKTNIISKSITIPYKIGGWKNIKPNETIFRNRLDDAIEESQEKKYEKRFNSSFLILPAKLSNKVYSHVDKLYKQTLKDMFTPKNIFNLKMKMTENNLDNNDFLKVDHENYTPSFLKNIYSFNKNDNISNKINIKDEDDKKNFIENLENKINIRYKFINKEILDSTNNKIIFDKIFIHLNYSEKNFDLSSAKIKSVDHNTSKSIYVFNYKSENTTIANNFKVRFSFWVKTNTPYIIEKENDDNKNGNENLIKINEEELHHIMLELDDCTLEMNYLRFFSKFSWVNILNKLIDPKIFEGKNEKYKTKIEYNLSKLKVCDFDLYLSEKEKMIKNNDKNGYNEMFYIKYL
jgi:hypothetical protein